MRTYLVTQGIEKIMDAIADGTFRPGDALPPETNLAAYLEVSRPTMREVVRTLADRGVVEVVHGRGTFVTPINQWNYVRSRMDVISRSLDPKTIGIYLTEVRRMIEVGSSGLAAARATEADIEKMTQALAAYDAATERGDVAATTDADVAFHTALLEATGNPFVSALMIPLAGALAESRRKTNAVDEVRKRASRHHHAILDAVIARDEQAAKDAMRAHMTQTFDDISTFLPDSMH
ncbi:FadR/GntR family transcriptional regulator [Corynebacterium silvaticum]|uniref:FadR/GntR family transcriptional regulator n=1 Tax=Corynebacterium silvaticum TaxID=2320431 RepID=A0A7U5QQE8_9CORY|nr:FadR/GntR family transcriptional regulator [Corynebacterium silvaticum]ARU47047.1 FadR/GntR family transcriptional regulator [Corynebacterium silvaticum]UWH05346.1 FadR family transcriptional regulator [Corynebacterium silvaticum]